MARFEIVFKQSVARDLRGIPNKHVSKILARIRRLAENPHPPESSKLSGQERYRLRQGNYRLLYEVHEHEVVIVVIKVAHRREVCRQN